MPHSAYFKADQEEVTAAPLLRAECTIKPIDVVRSTVLLKFFSKWTIFLFLFTCCSLFLILHSAFGPTTLSLKALFYVGSLLCVTALITLFLDLLYTLPTSLYLNRFCKNQIVFGPQEILFYKDKMYNKNVNIQHALPYDRNCYTWKIHSYIFIHHKSSRTILLIHIRDFPDREAFDRFFCRVQDIFRHAAEAKRPTPHAPTTAPSKFPRSGRDNTKPIAAAPSAQC